jgi:glycogen debranching enzyme
LDETRDTQQYYIATRSSPADDHAKVLKYGQLFAVFGRLGDIGTSGLGEQGLFFQGTRHLSVLNLTLWGEKPLLLSSALKEDNFLFTADLTNLDLSYQEAIAVPRGTIHLQRSKFLSQQVCYEELKFSNYGASRILVPFSIGFDADFADIFEVRGTHRARRGRRLEDHISANSVALAYEGLDDKVRRTFIRSDPAPKRISPTEMQFEIVLQPREEAVFHLEISCDRESVRPSVGYRSAAAEIASEHRISAAAFPRIGSTNSRLSDWIEHSLADVQMMTMGNPEVNYPYAGVPWFSTVFGRDGIITALQTLWLNPAIARGVLEHLAATQATDFDETTEAEPGKILHEARNGEMAALKEIPFGRYYGSVDATPLFIVLAGKYFERTGDKDYLRKLWPHIELALRWIDQSGDIDADGFVEYAQRNSKGLVQQGWKDSNDSVFHADGALAEAPIALCEVQGYVYAAKLAASELSWALGNETLCSVLNDQAEALRKKFEEAFWCEELSTYALALDKNKSPCRVRSSNVGHCLFSGIVSTERAQRAATTLMHRDSFSGWGVRTVAAGQARYNPLSYHNGSIWPHDNSIIAAGLARYDRKDLSGKILLGLLDASRWADLYRLPELFCGLERRAGEGPTLYPVACSPQAWSAGTVFLLLQSCLGLSVEGARSRVVFDKPYLPEGIPQLWIKGLQSGDAVVDLFFERFNDEVRVGVTDRQGKMEVLSKS